MNSIPRFRVSIKEVIPADRRLPKSSIPAAYIGVSVGNPSFNGGRLSALLDWAAAHVDRCCLLIGGEVSRWTVMAERSMDEESARVVARRHARRQLSDLRKAIS